MTKSRIARERHVRLARTRRNGPGCDVTSVGGRRPRRRRRPRSWEDVQLVISLGSRGGEASAGRLKEALNELTTTLLLLPGPGWIRPTTPFPLSDEARRQTSPVCLPPLLLPSCGNFLSVLQHSFTRTYGKKNRTTVDTTEGRDRGDESLSI